MLLVVECNSVYSESYFFYRCFFCAYSYYRSTLYLITYYSRAYF